MASEVLQNFIVPKIYLFSANYSRKTDINEIQRFSRSVLLEKIRSGFNFKIAEK